MLKVRALTVAPIASASLRLAGGQRRTPEEHPHNLPHPLTSFVGRQQEIAEARRLLAGTRLLTLTGAGGIGKTRLGHEVAASQLARHPDGVWLVELAALTDPALVPRAIAGVLDVREEAGRPLTATLADALATDTLLLVLDNCEHLIEACAAVADALLRACSKLRILATSRQPFGIAGETTFRVPSLTLSSCPAATAEVAPASEAVGLFVERARAVVPGFTPTDRDRRAVEQICRRLDGIPLAIELAAARVAVLSPEQIAARLGDRFHLLSGGSRTALPRYRTLRALLDWSHDLLDERERLLMRRLAVFAGGWALDAAESVCAGDGLASDEILDLLAGLVAKSIVQTAPGDDGVRYWFLESLREYATEKLSDAGEETTLRERHCAWLLALAEQAAPELSGPRQDAWLDRLDRERENLRAAQRWVVARGDAETTARLGAALWQFWWARADASEAREEISAITAVARQGPPTATLVRALHGAATLAGGLSDYATGRSLLGEGLAVARQLEERCLLATLLDSLGRQSFVEGRYAEARTLLDEALAIFRERDDRHGIARALSHLGFLDYLDGRHEAARATYREGLGLAREAGDSATVAEFLDNLGRAFHAEGDFDAAFSAYREAEGILREIGQAHRLAMVLNNLVNLETLRGDLGAARAHLAEALRLSDRIGNRRRLAFTLAAISTLAAAEGQAERAVRLHAVASLAVAQLGALLAQPMNALAVQHVERARRALGAAGAATADAAADATTLAQAVEETLAWLAEAEAAVQTSEPAGPDEPAVSPVSAAAPPRPDAGGLSPREREVAALVARGMTNRRIAEALVITEGTAANHVKHILARLTLDSRVQIAAWAIERGLHLPQPS